VKQCLTQDKQVKPEVPDHAELMKTERVQEGDLHNLLVVLMSLCESDTKSQVESGTKFLY